MRAALAADPTQLEKAVANLLSAHRDLANPAHRAEVAALWGVPDVPAKPGRTDDPANDWAVWGEPEIFVSR